MRISRRTVLAGIAGSFLSVGNARADTIYDVVVYGGTPSGVMAAYAAAREGASVALVFAGPLGGMMANGLGDTDVGRMDVIAGLCAELFRRNGRRYGLESQRDFEPSVARGVFGEFLHEADVVLARSGTITGVTRAGALIEAIRLDTGQILKGRAFIDASYEGDLMALSGAPYRVGRESRDEFGEPLNGFNAFPSLKTTQTHDLAGRPLTLFQPMPTDQRYAADRRVQSYGFRVCLTRDKSNMVPFPKPANYDADRYLFEINRVKNARNRFPGFAPHSVPGGKYDLNGHYMGRAHEWPEASWERRRSIWRGHYNYHAGLIYTFGHDPRVPARLRDYVNSFGLPKDEFQNNGNWPEQLYVREARRLRGYYVLQQKDLQTSVTKLNSIGLGSYSMDNHGTGLYIVKPGLINHEGAFSGAANDTVRYEIPYQILMPREISNLFVSVCASATQVAMCSLRMEPQYIMMGEASGLAAAFVARDGIKAIDLRQDIAGMLVKRGVKVRA